MKNIRVTDWQLLFAAVNSVQVLPAKTGGRELFVHLANGPTVSTDDGVPGANITEVVEAIQASGEFVAVDTTEWVRLSSIVGWSKAYGTTEPGAACVKLSLYLSGGRNWASTVDPTFIASLLRTLEPEADEAEDPDTPAETDTAGKPAEASQPALPAAPSDAETGTGQPDANAA